MITVYSSGATEATSRMISELLIHLRSLGATLTCGEATGDNKQIIQADFYPSFLLPEK